MPKGEELDRRERIEIYSSFFCLEALPSAHAVNLSFSRHLFQPSSPPLALLSPGEISSIVMAAESKGIGKMRESVATPFSVLVVVCTSGNRIVLRDKIKKARNVG